ncbi:kinase [Pilimelia terevasa]|uniref:kinase n=1 Tax=Pilimelia terevasa TaxID=53372 RepID=UPI00166B7AD4|nr:kinase [Pilimelia terevasa]
MTDALKRISPRYSLFPRLKVGPGKTAGYRMSSEAAIEALRAAKEIVWENRRYAALYAIDRPMLDMMLTKGNIPILHMGQPEGIEAVVRHVGPKRCVVVHLWCARVEAIRRLKLRDSVSVAARLKAWDDTPEILSPCLRIDTGVTKPPVTAALIHAQMPDHRRDGALAPPMPG